MLPHQFEDSLSAAELQFNEVSAALVSGEPVALAGASAALRQAALDLSALMNGLCATDRHNQALKLRLSKLAAGLAAQRESLIRRTVLVERALHTLVPAARSATYAQAGATYASPGKQSGTFKVLAA